MPSKLVSLRLAGEKLQFRLSEEEYKLVSQYMTEHRLNQTDAIKAIIKDYFASLKTQTSTSDIPQNPTTETPSKANEKWTEKEARKIELAYQIAYAKQRGIQQAKSEGQQEREHTITLERAKRRGQSQKQSSIDMGDSAGVPEEYIF